MYRLLIINPGSTSTKVSLFEDEKVLFEKSLFHDADELLKHIKASIMKDGHWPNNQNLVTETSY